MMELKDYRVSFTYVGTVNAASAEEAQERFAHAIKRENVEANDIDVREDEIIRNYSYHNYRNNF